MLSLNLLLYNAQKRHRQDDAVNNRKVDVFRNDKFVEVKWTEV